MNTIRLYEGSYLFHDIKDVTEQDIEKTIEQELKRQYSYRPTTESLWATVIRDGKEIARYEWSKPKGLVNKNFKYLI
jgi:hypothetical protein